MWNINLDQNKLYLQLFNIFEKELLTIFEYVAPTKENRDTYWNRIHELLLRIWAEVENIAKWICSNIAQTKKEETDWIENATSEKFLKYLNQNLSIKEKAIQFTAWLEVWETEYITPFWNKSWRENYDNLKHWKMENYNNCNLWNVIMALWWYYILLNYLLLWYNKTRECKSIIMVNPSVNLGISSFIFAPTTSFDKKSFTLHLIYWDEILLDENDVQRYTEELLKIDLEIPNNSPLKEQEYLFYTHFCTTSKISWLDYLKAISTPEKAFNTKHLLKPEFWFVN